MYTIYVYNNESTRLERYRLEAYHDMPYTSYNSLSVSDFFSNSISLVGWSSSEFLQRWSCFSKGRISPHSAFRRLFEGGHIAQSMHYAGLATDFDTPLFNKEHSLFEHGHFSYQPQGYPELSPGSLGVFVLVMQDALSTLGFCEGALDGFFGPLTESALNRFKAVFGLPSAPLCDGQTWHTLTWHAAGCGVTPTVSHIVQKHRIYCSQNPVFS